MGSTANERSTWRRVGELGGERRRGRNGVVDESGTGNGTRSSDDGTWERGLEEEVLLAGVSLVGLETLLSLVEMAIAAQADRGGTVRPSPLPPPSPQQPLASLVITPIMVHNIVLTTTFVQVTNTNILKMQHQQNLHYVTLILPLDQQYYTQV